MLTPKKRIARTCALTLVAGVCWGALAGPALAAFPGADGRIMWVEGEKDPESGYDDFAVNQLAAPGEPREREGFMECYDTPEFNLSTDERLCPFFRPTFSPDGRTIALGVKRPLDEREYASPRRANLALEDANSRFRDGQLLPDLTEADREPAWSPDGRRLVFVGRVKGVTDLYTVRPDGTDLRQVTSSRAVEGRPVWSSRGQIAFECGRAVLSVRAQGGGLRRLTFRGRNPDWSPDGRRLIFDRARRMYTVSRAGRGLRRLAGTGIYPAWAPSGRRIAFRRKFDIHTARPDGTRRRRVYDWIRTPTSRPRGRYAPRDISWGPRLK